MTNALFVTFFFIWICHSKGQDPIIGRFLNFIKQTYEIEKNSRTAEKKWDLFVSFLQLETEVSTASTCFCDLDWLHFLTILY